MPDRALALKQRLRDGATAVGAFLSLTDPAVAEILAGAGYDWVWIDTEHAPWSPRDLQTALMAFERTATVPIVRVAWNDPVRIKLALDAGAEGIVAPMVRTVAEAEALVSACRYPPDGTRGFGPRRASGWGRGIERYMAQANEAILVVPQIEDWRTAEIIDGVLAVPGIDAVAIGPNDLSGTVGALRQHDHPRVKAAIDRVLEAAKARGLAATLGIVTPPEQTAELAARGVRMILAASDVGLLVKGYDAALAAARGTGAAAEGREVDV
jgi:2-keto-3-deoxy-L-rhamnonate aldolase RhmA